MTVGWFLLWMAAVIALTIGLVGPAAVVRFGGPPTRKRAMRMYGALAVVFFITFAGISASTVTMGAVRVASASSSSSEKPTGLIPVTVVKDVDGDTIDVRMPNGTVEPVRMLLIDTPETVDPKMPVEPYGPQASSFCKQKLPVGKRVYLEEGVEKWDKYHRLLAYVWITPSDMYNEDVVRAGLARVAYVYAPNTKYLSRLEADEAYAKSHHLGIWTIPGYVTPQGYNLAAVRGTSTAVASVSRTSSKATPIRHTSTRSSSHTTASGLTVVASHLNVARGDEASVTIKTRPGATGTIEVRYKSGPSHAKGLTPKTADSRGLITWTWVVGTHTTPGNWPVYISAAGKTLTLILHVR